MGLSLGIGPAVTYSNAGELVQVVRQMPLERLLHGNGRSVLPSARFEGKRATSDMIADVCEVVAQIRGDVTPQEVALAAREKRPPDVWHLIVLYRVPARPRRFRINKATEKLEESV